MPLQQGVHTGLACLTHLPQSEEGLLGSPSELNSSSEKGAQLRGADSHRPQDDSSGLGNRKEVPEEEEAQGTFRSQVWLCD